MPRQSNIPGIAAVRASARAAVLAAAALLAGCAATSSPPPPKAPVVPAAFREASADWTPVPPAEAQPRGQWWKAFRDPMLDELCERAGRDNNTLQTAAARLAQAHAALRTADADRSPQLGVSAGATRQGGPLLNAAGGGGTLITAGASASYEVDVFGRLAKASKAAAADVQSREALLQSTRLLVQADTAQAYLRLRALDAERELVRGSLAAHRETLRLTQARYESGSVAELDVVRASREAATVESDLLALDRQRAEVEHAIAALVGEAPSTFRVAEAAWTSALPGIPAGIPAAILARRPDVSAAQAGVLAAQARLGVAQKAWFPNVTLTANGGYAAPELAHLFEMSQRAWGLGILFALPVFDGGRREAAVQNASAEVDAAGAAYREQVLQAFREVEDRLSALRLLGEQAVVEESGVKSAARAVTLAESRYQSGFISQLEVLDARRGELAGRRAALHVRADQYQATVGLIRALGGGWGPVAPTQ